jgi:hypothetical protein
MPLLGQFSEASGYLPHGQAVYAPGPSLYWLLAIPAQFVGRWPWAPLVWTALAEAGVIIGIVWLAVQLGGRLLAVASALGLVLLTAAIGVHSIYSPWSVNVPILPMVLLVFLTWAILEGSYRLLPLAVLVVSFEVQADPSFGFVSVSLTGVIFVAMGVAWWRARAWGSERRRAAGLGWPTTALAAGVAVVLWLPALVQQVTTSPGNLTLLARSSRRQGAREGVAFGLAILGKVVTRWPTLEFSPVALNAGSGAPRNSVVEGTVLLVALAALVFVSGRGGATHVCAGLSVLLAVSLGLVVAAALLPADSLAGGSFWLLGWSPLVGMAVWVIGGWAIWTYGAPRLSSRTKATSARTVAPRTLGVGLGLTLLAAAAEIGYLVYRPDPRRTWYPAVRRVTAEIAGHPHSGRYAVGVQMAPTVPLLVGQGLVLALDTHGVAVGANNGFERNLGSHYRLPRDGSVAQIVIYGDVNRFGFTAPPPRSGRVLFSRPVDLSEYGKQVVVHVVLLPPARPAATR